MKRSTAFLAAALLVLGTGAVVWSGLNLPPPLFVLDHGLHPGCEPNGKVVKVEGVEFVGIRAGICRIGSDYLAEDPKEPYLQGQGFTRGDVLGRFCPAIALAWGEEMKPSWEMPVHWVSFPSDFAIARTEITNAEYERFDPNHERSRSSKGDRDPVVDVNWDQARAYCEWLTRQSGYRVHLPSEAEWECAARSGTETEYLTGDDPEGLGAYAWCGGGWKSGAHDVGTKKANAWGLFDMTGNVWEWCEDRWHPGYAQVQTEWKASGLVTVSTIDHAPENGSSWKRGSTQGRVIRGGAWLAPVGRCRLSCRGWLIRSSSGGGVGFRPALSFR